MVFSIASPSHACFPGADSPRNTRFLRVSSGRRLVRMARAAARALDCGEQTRALRQASRSDSAAEAAAPALLCGEPRTAEQARARASQRPPTTPPQAQQPAPLCLDSLLSPEAPARIRHCGGRLLPAAPDASRRSSPPRPGVSRGNAARRSISCCGCRHQGKRKTGGRRRCSAGELRWMLQRLLCRPRQGADGIAGCRCGLLAPRAAAHAPAGGKKSGDAGAASPLLSQQPASPHPSSPHGRPAGAARSVDRLRGRHETEHETHHAPHHQVQCRASRDQQPGSPAWDLPGHARGEGASAPLRCASASTKLRPLLALSAP